MTLDFEIKEIPILLWENWLFLLAVPILEKPIFDKKLLIDITKQCLKYFYYVFLDLIIKNEN